MADGKTFLYETELNWSREREGDVRGAKLPSIPIGAPPEFQGREGNWTPEHLFVASVNGCLMLTLLAIAENSKLRVQSYSSMATGKLERVQGSSFQITEILIRPKIVVTSAQDLARISRLLEKAKENCFITNSIKSAVTLEPEVLQQT
jgi:peroxiredoxin-like protein